MDAQNPKETLSIIMPAYNEGALIQRSLLETIHEMERWKQPYEIVVVDDGSTDDTYAQAQAVAARQPGVRVVHYERNHGKGRALRVGFGHCNGDLVAFLDADLDLHPRQLRSLYWLMQETGAEVVIGSKHHPASRLECPRLRKFISAAYFGLVRTLFGLSIRDTQTGIKLFRRAVLANAFPRIRTVGYAYDLELLVAAARLGYRIAEAPVEMTSQRSSIRGRIGVRAILGMAVETVGIFYRASFWKWLGPSTQTKLWMAAFVSGLVVASAGAASMLTFMDVPDGLRQAAYFVTLKFMPRLWRDLLFVAGGSGVCLAALIQLNKSLMRAFMRADSGDLVGMLRGPFPTSVQPAAPSESQLWNAESDIARRGA